MFKKNYRDCSKPAGLWSRNPITVKIDSGWCWGVSANDLLSSEIQNISKYFRFISRAVNLSCSFMNSLNCVIRIHISLCYRKLFLGYGLLSFSWAEIYLYFICSLWCSLYGTLMSLALEDIGVSLGLSGLFIFLVHFEPENLLFKFSQYL